MNQNIDIETKAQSQNGQGFKEAFAGMNQLIDRLPSNLILRRFTAGSPALLIGRERRHLGRDGPPGRARSPGISFRTELHSVPSQLFNTTMKLNILIQTKIQIFTNMKKQILILALFVLALFVGTSTAFAQLVPRPVTCLTYDALHPVPGTPYTYMVDVPNITGTSVKTYTWFVTQNQKFIELVGTPLVPQLNYTTAFGAEAVTGGKFMAAGTGYATPGSLEPSISITWKSFAYVPSKPLFVVVQAVGDNGVCTPNNLKVYEIKPLFAFTLDIDNLTADGANDATPIVYGDNMDNCISDIQSATYDVAAADAVIYNYGKNTLYFEVVAANWFDRWKLSTMLGGLDAKQTAQIDWAYAPDRSVAIDYAGITTWNVVEAAGATNGTFPTSGAGVLVAPQNGTNSVDKVGESIIIRVIVDHGSMSEGITDNVITLAVDGVLYHETTLGSGDFDLAGVTTEEGDIHFEEGPIATPVCPYFDLFDNDIAIQTIVSRPEVQSKTDITPNDINPATNELFLPISPN